MKTSYLIKGVLITGLLLYLGTFIFPFLSIHISCMTPLLYYATPLWNKDCRVDFWSFMMHSPIIHATNEVHLFYWFNSLGLPICFEKPYGYLTSDVAWSMIFLFLVQIATLTMAVASFFMKRKFITLAPSILCLLTTLLMTSISTRFSQISRNEAHYGLGYWLTYPSLSLFIINMAVVDNYKRQEISREKSVPTKAIQIHHP